MTTRATRPLLSTALCAALTVALTSATAMGPATSTATAESPLAAADGAAGIGDPYWPLDGNGGIDVTAYRIDNRYDLASKRLAGHTTVELTATQDLSSFSLDFLLHVSSVEVDGTDAAFTRTDGHELRITPS